MLLKRHIAYVVLTGLVIVGSAKAFVDSVPLKDCDQVIAPLKVRFETEKCFMNNRGGDADYVIMSFICSKSLKEIIVLVTKPDSPVDNKAQSDPNMTPFGRCQVTPKDRANIYTHEGEIHVQPGQQADNDSALSKDQK